MPPSHEIRLSASGLTDAALGLAESRLLRRLRRRGIAYFAVREWSRGRHLHVTVRTPGRLTSREVGRWWVVTLPPGARCSWHCARIRDPTAWARYVLKDTRSGGEVVPKGFRGRVVSYSRDFLARPMGRLWAEVKEESFRCKKEIPAVSDVKESSVPLSRIDLRRSPLVRAADTEGLAAEYAETMRAGSRFPAVVLFGDAVEGPLLVGDGRNRVVGAGLAGLKHIDAEVRPGGWREALAYAVGANNAHGLRRTNADKRLAVSLALEEFGDQGDRELARMCRVSHTYVAQLRREVLRRHEEGAAGNVASGEEDLSTVTLGGVTFRALCPRRHEDPEAFAGLCESIRRLGLLQDPVVAPDGCTVVDGMRRLRALAELGLPPPDCVRADRGFRVDGGARPPKTWDQLELLKLRCSLQPGLEGLPAATIACASGAG
jgi:hypothetical protein